ncbi:hypothetical protein [Allomuricauda sp. ARW1Y1]|jgi:hypothetical protein|uniref:hypothetical protein n=1 Tax=Allomuricauda sp. ARW1Y1 TaxID=2663843 RepID=UPI0015C958FA|nr:hypothetical protein [Muricauda sp. ARW1Y1]NYJ26335.1 hypothetical protein [Muricauda sp. ARW1Y1]
MNTIKYLADRETRIEFTGNPPMLDRPVFLLNQEGERIGAAPEGEHLLESGKVAVIDNNGLLKGVREKKGKPTTIDLRRNPKPSTYKMFFNSDGTLKNNVRLSLESQPNSKNELLRLAKMHIENPITRDERLRNSVIEARMKKIVEQ